MQTYLQEVRKLMLKKNYLNIKHKLSLTVLLVIFGEFTYSMGLPKNYLQNISATISGLNQRFDKVKPKSKPAKYSQSDAFVSINTLKDYAEDSFSTEFGTKYTITYKSLIEKMLATERKLKDDYYVFYHATDSRFIILEDLFMALCQLKGKCKSKVQFIILRDFDNDAFQKSFTHGGIEGATIEKWMDKKAHYLTDPLQFNNQPDVQPYLLSVNFSLFANLGRPHSNTLRYFFNNFSAAAPPMGKLFDETIAPYVSDSIKRQQYVNQLKNISNQIGVDAKHIGIMLQIFIPKKLVDNAVYLSKQQGYYWDYKIPENKSLDKIYSLTKHRYTQVAPILERYQNNPERLALYYDDSGTPAENSWSTTITPKFTDPATSTKKHIVIDRIEGRLFLKKEYFATPDSGILIYRYTTLTNKQEKNYKKQVSTIAKEVYNYGKH